MHKLLKQCDSEERERGGGGGDKKTNLNNVIQVKNVILYVQFKSLLNKNDIYSYWLNWFVSKWVSTCFKTKIE